ncbi:hypothetical protein [Terribacillus saccharophilus]|uniref:PBECR3 domain-containing polyvalent protein n=1 Tax=Terribacillus saccharophilus TaxID=361277 RepID=UPI000BA7BA05|nr:hypothetical protein CHH51_06945 [Terribacillus saccharophilus]
MVNPNGTKTQTAGKLPEKVINRYNLKCSSNDVLIFPGAIKHIKKNHEQIFLQHCHHIPSMISNPDYVGQNPKTKGV